MKEKKQSTKSCPECGNTNLVLLRTKDMKCCLDCHTDIPWYLDDNQKLLG